MNRATFVFDTTTAALWAEEVADAERIPCEVVPAPAESDARCDLALVTLPDRAGALSAALTREGVAHRPWPPVPRVPGGLTGRTEGPSEPPGSGPESPQG